MVKKNLAARLKQVLVNEAHDGDIELGSGRSTDDGVVVVNNLLERTDGHGTAPEVVDLGPVLLILLLACRLWFEALLVLDELLLHEQVVLDPLHLEELEAAAGGGVDSRQLGRGIRTLLLLTLADAGG